MNTLGINAAFHDQAACLVTDGKVVAAAEEERFTHIKHGKRPVPFSTWELPFHAIDFCLSQANLQLAEVDHVAYSFDPSLLLGRWKGSDRITLPLEPAPADARRLAVAMGPALSDVDRKRAGGACRRRAASPGGALPWGACERALPVAFRAPSPGTCGQRFSCLPPQPRGGHDARRPRRGCHNRLRAGCRQSAGMARPGPHAALAGSPLRARHGVPRFPSFVRRVQGDGAGLVRQAALRG